MTLPPEEGSGPGQSEEVPRRLVHLFFSLSKLQNEDPRSNVAVMQHHAVVGRSPTKRQNAGDDLASLRALFWDTSPFSAQPSPKFRITTSYPRKIVKSTPVESVECRLTVGYML